MESRSVCSDEQLCVQAQKGDRLAEEQVCPFGSHLCQTLLFSRWGQ